MSLNTHRHTHTHTIPRVPSFLWLHTAGHILTQSSQPKFFQVQQPPVGQGLVVEASRSHSIKHTKLGTTALDEWSARRRDLYLTSHTTHKREKNISPAGLELKFPASEQPQNPRLRTRGNWDQLNCEIRSGEWSNMSYVHQFMNIRDTFQKKKKTAFILTLYWQNTFA